MTKLTNSTLTLNPGSQLEPVLAKAGAGMTPIWALFRTPQHGFFPVLPFVCNPELGYLTQAQIMS